MYSVVTSFYYPKYYNNTKLIKSSVGIGVYPTLTDPHEGVSRQNIARGSEKVYIYLYMLPAIYIMPAFSRIPSRSMKCLAFLFLGKVYNEIDSNMIVYESGV
jgi:hypothetical protein